MNKRELAKAVGDLSSPSRRKRQEAAHAIAENTVAKPQSILDFIDDIFDALERPEAQTRWELLHSLTHVVKGNVKALSEAIDFVEPSLFDEGSSTVRLAAFRFISTIGSQTKALSKKVWPMLDESLQVYHGDSQYREMLVSLEEFVSAPIDPEVKKAAVARINFDAQNSTLPIIKKLSNNVLKAAKGIKPRKIAQKKALKRKEAKKPTTTKGKEPAKKGRVKKAVKRKPKSAPTATSKNIAKKAPGETVKKKEKTKRTGKVSTKKEKTRLAHKRRAEKC